MRIRERPSDLKEVQGLKGLRKPSPFPLPGRERIKGEGSGVQGLKAFGSEAQARRGSKGKKIKRSRGRKKR
jgi:hypothetical protein